MSAQHFSLEPGIRVHSPGGRLLEVSDIFVPKNDDTKRYKLPVAFRSLGRKVVVFHDGSIAPLTEVRRSFRPVSARGSEIGKDNTDGEEAIIEGKS